MSIHETNYELMHVAGEVVLMRTRAAESAGGSDCGAV